MIDLTNKGRKEDAGTIILRDKSSDNLYLSINFCHSPNIYMSEVTHVWKKIKCSY